jgi:signal transduction histidine kinase/CheY-like chemotaxis protein
MVEAGPQAVLLVSRAGKILACDTAILDLGAQILGRALAIGDDLLAAVADHARDEVRAAIAEALDGREVSVERRAVDASGASRVLAVHVAPAPGVDGVCVTVWPVDERRLRAEEALISREGQLRAAMEAGRIVPWEWNVERDVVERALDIGIMGPPPASLETFLAHVHPDDRAQVRDALAATFERDAPYAITYRKVLGDETRWLDARAALVRDSSGRPLKMVGIVADITAQRRLEERLVQAQKMEAIGRLAGGVAHDFNNILTAIVTSSHLLARRVGDGPEIRHVLDAADRAAALTRQLLAFSRRQILRSAVIDLGGAVFGMVSLLRRIVGEDVELRTDFASDLHRVRADATQLEQVVLNLALNARDAMPTGGELHVSLGNVVVPADRATSLGVGPGAFVRMRVRDTGVGMDSATKAHLFEPFFTTKGPGVGTGLGLATAYGIIVQLGGTITVESEPHAGATFDVYLPRCDEDDRVVPDVARAFPREGSETILLVEDEPSVRELTRQILELHGYRVLEAHDGERALVEAERYAGPIHLLLTDVVMPRMGGMTTAQRVKSLRPDVKVLFVTGYTDDAMVRHGVIDGEVSLLRKPYTPDTLAGAVKRALAGEDGT